MIYGYARVSTAAQDETGQVRQLKAAGCEKVFREKITGTTADRPQLHALMKKLAPGDVVITPAVDRLFARHNRPSGYRPRHAARRGRYPLTGRTVPRYHVRFRRDHLRHPWRCREAGAPPHSRSAPRAAGPTPRRRASNSAASRPSRRTSRKRPASASKPVRRSAASPAATNVSQSTISRLGLNGIAAWAHPPAKVRWDAIENQIVHFLAMLVALVR